MVVYSYGTFGDIISCNKHLFRLKMLKEYKHCKVCGKIIKYQKQNKSYMCHRCLMNDYAERHKKHL
jgi:predicted nucleic acid-binding Zn ribbon protein